MPLTIAIDGTSGSGKSSTSRLVAQRLGLEYVDTGAMYRAITWWMLDHGIDPADADAVAAHATTPTITLATDPTDPHISVDGRDVSHEIRTPEVSAAVSLVSAVPEVRHALVERQRQIAAASTTGVVMEGRDIGTVVLPDADLKIYLTADARARAHRRALQDAARGTDMDGGVAAVEANLRERDHLDSTRAVSPLTKADDAIHVDGTHLDLDGVVAAILEFVPRS